MSSVNLVTGIQFKLSNESALHTGEVCTCEFGTLFRSFYRGTLSIHWYMLKIFSLSFPCFSYLDALLRLLKMAMAMRNFIRNFIRNLHIIYIYICIYIYIQSIKRVLSTEEPCTCEHVTLLQLFHRFTLSIQWYKAQNFQATFAMSFLFGCSFKTTIFNKFLKVAMATSNFMNDI